MIRLITPILVIALALVCFFYFTTPVISEINELKLRRLELVAALDNATRLKSRQDALLDLENAMDPNDVMALKQLLPNNIDNVRLIIDINTIAKKYGLTVRNPSVVNNDKSTTDSRPAGQVTIGDSNSVVISFSVTASYDILKLFLDNLAHSLRIVDLESLSFASNDKNFYDYKISLRTYWLK